MRLKVVRLIELVYEKETYVLPRKCPSYRGVRLRLWDIRLRGFTILLL